MELTGIMANVHIDNTEYEISGNGRNVKSYIGKGGKEVLLTYDIGKYPKLKVLLLLC